MRKWFTLFWRTKIKTYTALESNKIILQNFNLILISNNSIWRRIEAKHTLESLADESKSRLFVLNGGAVDEGFDGTNSLALGVALENAPQDLGRFSSREVSRPLGVARPPVFRFLGGCEWFWFRRRRLLSNHLALQYYTTTIIDTQWNSGQLKFAHFVKFKTTIF